MTAPGQTAGLSVFTDPLITDLGIDRTAISLSYLIGTLVGAGAQPLVGRALDRWDYRRVIIVIAISFACFLFALSFVVEILGLTIGFVGIRMTGQGALSLAATTAVSRAIAHRRGLALGISSAVGSAGISLAPIGLERMVAVFGMSATWRWQAIAVLALVIPAALLLRPHKSASSPVEHRTSGQSATIAWTPAEARRTGMFWVVCAAICAVSMLGTGLAFHQLAVLGERGLSATEAAANFLPQTVAALLITLGVGALVDRMDPRVFIALSMVAVGGSLCLVSVVSPGFSAIGYGLVLGCAMGGIRGMEAATYARYFGVAHIGAIRGISMALGIAASALGPYALAVGRDIAGDFATPSMVLAIIPLIVLIASLFVRAPRRRSSDGGSPTR